MFTLLYQIGGTMAHFSMKELAEKLEHYSSLVYHPDLMARVRKAVRYMEEYERSGGITNRKLATIQNVVRSCATDRMVQYNTSPESDHYWCS